MGIDIEIPAKKVEKIKAKFLSEEEISNFEIRNSKFVTHHLAPLTLLWSAKESVFKWYGNGKVDFRQHIQLQKIHEGEETIHCLFSKTNQQLVIYCRQFDHLVMAWVVS